MDRILVERAQQGDREAFGQIALAISDRLYGVALRILRDPDSAGDALQTSLVQIWRDIPTLRDPDQFDGWSYRVTVRRCQAERRARARRSTDVLLGRDAPIGDVQLSVALRDELERAFRRLTVDQRAVLVLMYYRDQSVGEIAATLGISTGTVKSRLHYARSALRAAVEADARAATQEGRPA